MPIKNTLKYNHTTITYVSQLPDLFSATEVDHHHGKKRVKLQIELTDHGIEIIGDSPYDQTLDNLLMQCGVKDIQKTLCG